MSTTSKAGAILRFEIGKPYRTIRICPSVAKPSRWRYGTPVPAKSGAGRGNPNIKLAHKRPQDHCGRFFCICNDALWRLCVRHASAWPGANLPGFPPLRTVRHHKPRGNGGDGSEPQVGAVPMKQYPTRNPSALRERAQAHRAMALAALRADSSLSVRLKRYNAAMTKARALEAIAERLEATTTRDPRTALSWLQSGQSVHIDAVNLADQLRHVRALATLEAVGGEA